MAKLDLVKRSAKHFLMNKSNSDSNASQNDCNYHALPIYANNASQKNIFAQQIEGKITNHARSKFVAKIHSLNGKNELIDSSEQNHSVYLIAKIYSSKLRTKFERTAQQLINIIEMSMQNTPSRDIFDDEAQQLQTPETPTRIGTHTHT